MTTTVHGILKSGTIQLLEKPQGIAEGSVIVTIQQDQPVAPQRRPLTYGKYTTGPVSIDEDFKAAQWNGDNELGVD